MTDRGPTEDRASVTAHRAQAACKAAYFCAWLVFLAAGVVRLSIDDESTDFFQSLLAADVDTLVYLFWLVVAPLAWNMGRVLLVVGIGGPTALGIIWQAWMAKVAAATRGSAARAVWLSIFVAGVSLGTSFRLSLPSEHLLPAYQHDPPYHDEYSYLLQAKTFLAGRLSFPSHEAATLFDQMHVVNEGRFASRYFPGTGLWMAPFVAIGHPWWGHWLAGALVAVLIFWCGRELAGDFAGFLAGLLTALSPGMALFSNLLLAHHPTLVGLGLFLLGYLRGLRLSSIGWGLAAGAGLCFAALCRPMTAASIALPFGVHLVCWSIATGAGMKNAAERIGRFKVLAAIGAPLLAGGAFMLVYDHAITGDVWKTPYSLYTDVYTPRHVYGFYNVDRGEQRVGPKTIDKYDRWAANLTPRLAARNAAERLLFSWQWTLGWIPLTLALVVGLGWWPALSTGTRLILVAIVSLHLAHVPYWFVGIRGHHYVFESGPLWLLWLAVVTVRAFGAWQAERRWWMAAWWLGLVASALALDYSVRSGRWSPPLDRALLMEVEFGRQRHGEFRTLVEQTARPRPALVLVEDDPKDRHVDYVTNDPALDGDLLIARYLPETVPLEEVRRMFPGRTLFLFHAKERQLERLTE